jgi:hypothetical protein
MTLPEQSDRAVAATREFLVRLSSPYGADGIKGIRREIRAEALRLLRHYPYSWNGDYPEPDNAANEDNDERLAALQALAAQDEELGLPRCTPAALPAPSEGSEQNRCTITDEEREAGGLIVMHLDYAGRDHLAATLRGLLERTKGGER